MRGAHISRGAPLLLAAAAVVPVLLGASSGTLNTLILAAIYVVMALGLNVIVGFAGLLDLGYVAFFTIGAYAAAYFASGFWNDVSFTFLAGDSVAGMPGIHVNLLLVLALAAAAAALAGTVIGVPTLRLRGDYIAIVTLAFGEIIGQLVFHGRQIGLFGGTLTSGPAGILPIDRLELPLIGRLGALDLRAWYWAALLLVALALVVTVHLRDSRLGRAWMAVRDDEPVAACAGIPLVRTKLLAYATGAAFGGVAGAFYASYLGVVDPAHFKFAFSIFVLEMVVLGGLGSIQGAVLGAVVLSVVNTYLLPRVVADLPERVGLDFTLSEVSSGLYGVVLVLVMLLRPQGLLPPRGSRSSAPVPLAGSPACSRSRCGGSPPSRARYPA